MNTLGNLFLGSEPISVRVEDDQLIVMLADKRMLAIPLAFVSQVNQLQPLSAEAQLLILRHPPQIDHVHVTDTVLNVYFKDGRLLACPLSWFPRLLHGTPAERNYYEISGDDDVIHWPDLDEDIDLLRLFEGGKSIEREGSLQRWLLSRQAPLELQMAAS
jgi:Protein of unknown function (DUF2442)